MSYSFSHPFFSSLRLGAAVAVSALFWSGSAAAAGLAAADQTFLLKAAQGGATEVAASKAAQTKAASNDVKSFAQMMIKDHTAVGDELKQLAGSKGVQVAEQPPSAQQAKLDAMSKLDAKTFDKSYASEIGVNAHENTVALFEKASADAKDPDVKAFASKALPSLKHHLEMAKTLKAGVDKK